MVSSSFGDYLAEKGLARSALNLWSKDTKDT